jgi:hypothetical protein
MFAENDRRRLYWLIDQYLGEKISAWDFTSAYHEIYNIDLDKDILSQQEHITFGELNKIAGRFSDVEEDLKSYPGVYFSEADLRAEVLQTKQILAKQFATYEAELEQ